MDKLIYFAGLFDGEGCVRICKRKAYGKFKAIRYTLWMELQMSEKPSIDFIAKSFNKQFRIIKPSGDRRKIAYRFNWHARQARDILKLIFPYLHGKKEQAKVAIDFQNRISCQKGIPLTEKEIALREFFYQTLRNLKH